VTGLTPRLGLISLIRGEAPIASARAAWWAHRALSEVRSKLAAGGFSRVAVPPPPNLPAEGLRGVDALLRRRRHTCLEGALIRQRWLSAHGVKREVVIGVCGAGASFRAHAWVAGEEDSAANGMRELARIQS